MQHQFQTNTKRDLKQLIAHTQAKLTVLKNQICQQLPSAPNPSRHLLTQSCHDLQKSLALFSQYSIYVADYSAGLTQRLSDHKNKLKKVSDELQHYRNKTFQLEAQQLGYQKQLAEKDAEIVRLLHMLKIDASYISSTHMKNSEGCVSQEESSMISENSVEDQSGLNVYESLSMSNQLIVTDHQKKQGCPEESDCVSSQEIHCISMNLQAEKMILDLMALLDDDAPQGQEPKQEDGELVGDKVVD